MLRKHAALLESVKDIRNDTNTRKMLFEKSAHLRDSLRAKGFTVIGTDNIPSLPLFMGDEDLGVAFTDGLYERGIHCMLVRWPAASQGKCRFRVIVMADHSYEHLDHFADSCEEIGRARDVGTGRGLSVRSRDSAETLSGLNTCVTPEPAFGY